MNKNTLITLGIIIFLGLGFFLSKNIYQSKKTIQIKKLSEIFVRPHSPVFGESNASITIVEFLDPECEACRAVYPYMKELIKGYNGKVKLVVRYMPFHQNSAIAIKYLEAAREQGKFWETLEVLFNRQPEWASHHAPRPDLIPEIVKSAGVDMNRAESFLQQGSWKQTMEMDKEDGVKLNVNVTPTIFVNDTLIDELDFNIIRQKIDSQLNTN